MHVVPSVPIEHKVHAGSSSTIVWFSSCPECGVPGTAVYPFPGVFPLYVVASKPCHVAILTVEACSVLHSLQDKVEGGSREDRRQVASLPLAEVFSGSPILLVGTPQIAVVPALLPVLFAGLDALVVAAS